MTSSPLRWRRDLDPPQRARRRRQLPLAVALALASFAACSDPPIEDRGAADGKGALVDVGTNDVVSSDGGGVEVSRGIDAGASIDVKQSVDGADGGKSDGQSDGIGDDGQGDGIGDDGQGDGIGDDGQSDGIGDDGQSDDSQNSDGDGGDPCGVCPFNAQPTGDHPGAPGPSGQLEPKKIEYGSGFGQGYKEMLVFTPVVAGPHPVLFFVAGKSLYATGGFIGELGHAYRKLCEHVASYGVIVAFVRVEQGITDGDHSRMAKDLLEAQAKLFASVSTANDSAIAYAGHSMGAKVVVIAATLATAGDKAGAIADPKLVVAMNLSNEKPPLGVYLDAAKKVEEISADSDIWFTFVTAADDNIAPLDDPAKPNSLAVYEALKVAHKQIIVLHGTGKDDPNPATKPELADDHGAPMTIEGKPGGLADFVMPASHLDALDWYGYWKILAGAMRYHFAGGSPEWAYGALRSHGGATPDGTIITHEVKVQSWSALP